jgi:hypothetical protein
MQTILNEEDENLIVLEYICEELNVQLKLVMELISRSKQKKPHLEQQFKEKKQTLVNLIQDTNHKSPKLNCLNFLKYNLEI